MDKMETETCFYCYKNIPIDDFAQHEEDCESEHANDKSENIEANTIFDEYSPKSEVKAESKIKGKNGIKGRKRANELKCRFCNGPIYAKMNLIKHERLCEIIGQYRDGDRCLICNKVFGLQAKFHFRSKHLEIFDATKQKSLFEKAVGTCKHCNLEFKSGLRAHEVTCGEFVGILLGRKCLLCNKTFVKRCDALRHARKRTDCRRTLPRNEDGTYLTINSE